MMNKTTKRIVTVFIAMLFGGACFVGYIMWDFSAGMCGHEPPHVIVSPDGKHQALVFEGDCGATDHFHTYVSVLSKGKKLGEHELGNAFGIKEDQLLNAVWIDGNHLRIEYPAQAESNIHFRNNFVNGVSIDYVGVQ
jgi:hypothetical protein